MSTPPQETETHTLALSREQQWVVHHTLVATADEYLDDDEPVPPWLLTILERLEADEQTITDRQARNLKTLLDGREIPEVDAPETRAVCATLEGVLED
ncbi:hypothetical protein OB919_06715 [Halobacteria archaeon AArc-curdl1]|uniref:Uncharacterized protein n=1 Tax=Natronosalvus hydrolyticus TaxID=2979988 RepID=A0AAP2Z7I0_9EURY|nr:hypothetical protein [Halobacteria archaeon AArc-curdl1]